MRKTKISLIPAVALTALLLAACASSGPSQASAAGSAAAPPSAAAAAAETKTAETNAAETKAAETKAAETKAAEAEKAETDADTSGSSEETAVVPDFTFVDNLGTELRLTDILSYGKPVVLNFWATWCPPCRAEMPHFEAAFQKYGEEIEFMMMDLTDGTQDTVESAQKFADDAGYTFPVYFDTRQEGAAAYGIMAIPTTYFIFPDGTLAAWAQGGLSEEQLAEGIRRLQK